VNYSMRDTKFRRNVLLDFERESTNEGHAESLLLLETRRGYRMHILLKSTRSRRQSQQTVSKGSLAQSIPKQRLLFPLSATSYKAYPPADVTPKGLIGLLSSNSTTHHNAFFALPTCPLSS
jgi:hypothetical protein